MKIEKHFLLFNEIFAQILSCEKTEFDLDYSKINITNRINEVIIL
jgi:hypothetical protein